MEFDLSDYRDFCEHLRASNRAHLPNIEIHLNVALSEQEQRHFGAPRASLSIHLLDEIAGDSRHELPDGEYDPEYMHSRLSIRVWETQASRVSRRRLDETVNLAERRLVDNSIDDILRAFEDVTRFLLPKLSEMGLPANKDSWQ